MGDNNLKYFAINIARYVIRAIRELRRKLKIFELRLKGVDVHHTARIDPRAVIEPSGGLISIGKRTFIDRGVIIRGLAGDIRIGSDCFINAYCVLIGGGKLNVGDCVMLSAHTVIVTANHNFSEIEIPIKDQGQTTIGVRIDRDVWIGAGSRILDGVHIGEGTVIGAGSVVSKSIASYKIAVGVPAKEISSR